MAGIQIKSAGDQKKLIAAIALGVIAIVVLSYALFGSSGGSRQPATPRATGIPPSPAPGALRTTNTSPDEVVQPIPAVLVSAGAPEPGRNIFAFYEPPPPKPSPVVEAPIPSPTPPPPLLLASLSPGNVYARTADFTLEVSGDKFTPAVHVVLDGQQLPTRFIGPQQLAATVSAALIANPGSRQVGVLSPDGKLYSNVVTLNVAAPPVPNYSFVGIIGKPHFNDWAVLQDKNSKEILNVQRGDVLGGRFRVTSISERELVVTDSTLKIKHTLAFTRDPSLGNQMRPPPRAETDEEP
ncbi:MAG: hypothetical protein ABJC05_09115 [Pyrinomonadaceae bacterium]